MTDCGYEIKAPWTIGDNSDYDDEIWRIIFAEEGIIPVEDMLDAVIEGFEMTPEEYEERFGDEYGNL